MLYFSQLAENKEQTSVSSGLQTGVERICPQNVAAQHIENKGETMKASILQPILGIITIYLGKADLLRHELKYGDVVRVDGVFKLADIDSANFLLLDEDEVQAAGGVTAEDDIEVRRWIQDEGQFELMSWSAEAINLRCFAHLAE